MIKDPSKFGKLREIELSDFEKENNIKLPQDYKCFLLSVNGGIPEPSQNVTSATLVSCILGMHNGDFYASLYKHISIFKHRLPLSTFPIATDPFGNLFIMSMHPEAHGHIYFWNHEGEPEHQDGHHVDNCTFIAYSFTSFIENLK